MGPVLLAGGVLAIAYGLAVGQGILSLFLVFPVVTATGAWPAGGIVLLLAGFFLTILGWSAPAGIPRGVEPSPPTAPTGGQPPAGEPRPRRWGGVIFLGPLPIVFGSDAKVTRWMLVAAILLFVALLLFSLYLVWGL